MADGEWRGWIAQEFDSWNTVSLCHESLRDQLTVAARESASLYLFTLENGRFAFDDKSGTIFAGHPVLEPLLARAEQYRQFFQDSWDAFGGRGEGTFAITLADLPDHEEDLPCFCFQKIKGSKDLLVPDVDFFSNDFYIGDRFYDQHLFEDKNPGAVFVGSTTGDLPLTLEHVRNLTNARIRAATFFRGYENVIFWLPNVVQHDSVETHQAIANLGIVGRPMRWVEQLCYRYMISMDGNGATCSRVAGALMSRCVLLKYASPYELFYFKGLRPFEHFIPINADGDIAEITSVSSAKYEEHWNIAERSRIFAEHNLSRIALMQYTAELMQRYFDRFGVPGEAGSHEHYAGLFRLDVKAHISDIGTRWSMPRGFAKGGENQAIQSLAIVPHPDLDPRNVHLRVFDSRGRAIAAGWGNERCGGVGVGEPIFGVQLALRSTARERYAVRVDVEFQDGTKVRKAWRGRARSQSPVTGVRVRTYPRKGLDLALHRLLAGCEHYIRTLSEILSAALTRHSRANRGNMC